MEEEIREKISSNVDDNVNYIRGILQDNSDIIYREFYINKWKAALIYIDGMGDKLLLDDFVLKPLMKEKENIKSIYDFKDKVMAVSDVRDIQKLKEGINAMLSGDTLMLVESLDIAYVIATRLWPARAVGEPSSETVMRGSREGFTETVRFNSALVRRRIRDTRFRIKPKSIGTRSKTDVLVMYIDDIANKEVLQELEERINAINIDAVLDSGYIEQFIEDNKWSPFPQIQSTERPDVVAAALYEGRIAVLVDNSPFALIVPATLPNLFQSPDDYNQKWMYASFVRILRVVAVMVALILPALYVAVTSFHTSIIPTKLAYAIASAREVVPFPAFIEALIMEVSLEFLMEAIIRLPRTVGATIGIVGGLIIGQAAVNAGIVSPIMIIIVSITTITSFITPNYSVTWSFRIMRFFLILVSSIIGLYGIMMGLITILIHLVKLKSFGISYLTPLVNSNTKDFKDMFIKYPIDKLKERPKYMKTGDKIRQR